MAKVHASSNGCFRSKISNPFKCNNPIKWPIKDKEVKKVKYDVKPENFVFFFLDIYFVLYKLGYIVHYMFILEGDVPRQIECILFIHSIRVYTTTECNVMCCRGGPD